MWRAQRGVPRGRVSVRNRQWVGAADAACRPKPGRLVVELAPTRREGRGGAGRGCIPVTRANRAALRLLAQPAARMALRSFCSADGSDPLWVRRWAAGDGAARGGRGPGVTRGTLGRVDPAASQPEARTADVEIRHPGPGAAAALRLWGPGSGRAGCVRGGACVLWGSAIGRGRQIWRQLIGGFPSFVGVGSPLTTHTQSTVQELRL